MRVLRETPLSTQNASNILLESIRNCVFHLLSCSKKKPPNSSTPSARAGFVLIFLGSYSRNEAWESGLSISGSWSIWSQRITAARAIRGARNGQWSRHKSEIWPPALKPLHCVRDLSSQHRSRTLAAGAQYYWQMSANSDFMYSVLCGAVMGLP